MTRRCQLTVVFDVVDYRGDDIGDDWEFETDILGHRTQIDASKTLNGTTRTFSETVFNAPVDGPDQGLLEFEIRLIATERDGALSDDIGKYKKTVQVPIGGRERATMRAKVDEKLGTPGTAELTIQFEVTCRAL